MIGLSGRNGMNVSTNSWLLIFFFCGCLIFISTQRLKGATQVLHMHLPIVEYIYKFH